ncbi:GNAT family N-acetyltransferase [Gloeobacter kilaueensis]|uniref:GCN5-related N-acetyltransferase n=1 Tax=Gloeobacter kilaueensis (strain ATCC BAA-2537 / CCAP 1431/1 / ULC 316 / JS1) TaxID=1183438 RepID=U5QH20_GLOK1|nr:GNAT family N-acetyltransferase [Gloeobacter kilaueensis]AGY56904.1 GCN5-related N-acetyltransferase [Gloeobacter kilaueensis JS1]
MGNSATLSITFSVRREAVDPLQLQQLFDEGAFWAQNRSIQKLEQMLACSNPVVAAHADGKLVGFARATSDGVFRATIWDVVVHPQHQAFGIGRQLLQILLEQPQLKEVERVYLMTTFQQGFYEKLGFGRNSSTTMVLVQSEA